jgi:hypothetical protein
MIWREKRILLVVLGALLAANLLFFMTYRVQYQSRLTDLDERLKEAETKLGETRASRVRAEQQYRSYKQVEVDVARIYDDFWGTQSARLTPMISEVKRLTVASSLVPASISFDKNEVEVKTASERRIRKESIGATEVGISFGVNGTYEQVRRLINLLELSRQFVIIDQLGLSAGEGQNLNFNIHMKTLFRDDKVRSADKRL